MYSVKKRNGSANCFLWINIGVFAPYSLKLVDNFC